MSHSRGDADSRGQWLERRKTLVSPWSEPSHGPRWFGRPSGLQEHTGSSTCRRSWEGSGSVAVVPSLKLAQSTPKMREHPWGLKAARGEGKGTSRLPSCLLCLSSFFFHPRSWGPASFPSCRIDFAFSVVIVIMNHLNNFTGSSRAPVPIKH